MYKNKIETKKIAYIAALTTLAMIFSYVESLIPVNFGIPGIKLGVANIVSVISLYTFGLIPSLVIVVLRVLLTGFLFGNAYSIIYSLAGGVLSLLAMYLIMKSDLFSMCGISICGGVVHNLGQLLVAMLTVNQIKLSYYGPILIISGVIMGVIVGLICRAVYKRVETYVRLW